MCIYAKCALRFSRTYLRHSEMYWPTWYVCLRPGERSSYQLSFFGFSSPLAFFAGVYWGPVTYGRVDFISRLRFCNSSISICHRESMRRASTVISRN